MRTIAKAMCAALIVVVAAAAPASASNGAAEATHETVDVVAIMQTSTCLYGDWAPTVPTECRPWIVALYRHVEQPQPRLAPFRVEVSISRVIVYPDSSVDVLVLEDAYADVPAPDSSFDLVHLRYAHVRAAVPMSEARPATSTSHGTGADRRSRPLATMGRTTSTVASTLTTSTGATR
jgi:hypothetical protein